MSQSPVEASAARLPTKEQEGYFSAWRALGTLVRQGKSWSGNERNRCFLNLHGTGFADVSSVLGLDHRADSRSLALTDWDHDGDLDVWMTNRSAPRLQFLQNGLTNNKTSVTIRLEGTTCNRDAIGSRVELFSAPDDPAPIVRRLRAGEGFLGQSSKWLHFGLDHRTVDRLVVHWPRGKPETFDGIQPGGRYVIRQGALAARRVTMNRKLARFAESPLERLGRADAYRIKPARGLPLPTIQYRSYDGQTIELKSGMPTLLVLWAHWCVPCLAELEELQKQRHQIDAVGLSIVALNVDGVSDDFEPSARRADDVLSGRFEFSYSHGMATSRLLDHLEIAADAVTHMDQRLSVPMSFLLDSQANLVAVYVGPVGIDALLSDVESLAGTDADVRDFAAPYTGQWVTQPFPRDLLSLPRKLAEAGLTQDALAYLDRFFGPNVEPPSDVSAIADTYHQLGAMLMAQKQVGDAGDAFRSAIRLEPQRWGSHLGLLTTLQRAGRTAELISQNRRMLQLRPGHPLITNNLAWLLAASPQASLRRPREAVKLAEQLCQTTGQRNPSALDTLAVAYAATGDFPRAIEVAQQAAKLAQEFDDDRLAQKIKSRIERFKAGEPYIDELLMTTGQR